MTTIKDILIDLGKEVQKGNVVVDDADDFFEQIEFVISNPLMRKVVEQFIEEVNESLSDELDETVDSYIDWISRKFITGE